MENVTRKFRIYLKFPLSYTLIPVGWKCIAAMKKGPCLRLDPFFILLYP